jgi:hypothetical protein
MKVNETRNMSRMPRASLDEAIVYSSVVRLSGPYVSKRKFRPYNRMPSLRIHKKKNRIGKGRWGESKLFEIS